MPAILEMLEAHARHVTQESIKARLDLAAATPARQTQTHLSLAFRSQTALAMRAGHGQMEENARLFQAAQVVMPAEVAQEAASATQAALRLKFVETGSSLQVKYATMEMSLLETDARRVALWRVDTPAIQLHQIRASRTPAAVSAEMEPEMLARDATMATRQMLMGAAQHA
jgi:hypothetical protein